MRGSSSYILIFGLCHLSAHTRTHTQTILAPIAILHHDVHQALVTRNYTTLPHVSCKSDMTAEVPVLISYSSSLLALDFHLCFISLTPPCRGKKQAVTPAWVLTNLVLPCHHRLLLPSPPLSGSARCLTRAACWIKSLAEKKKKKSMARSLKLMPEDGRSQTNSHQSPLGHFF